MKQLRLPITFLLLLGLLANFLLPIRPAYAFSVQDVLGQTTSSNASSISGSKVNVLDLLIGLILSKFLGGSSNLSPAVNPLPLQGGTSSLGSKEMIGFYAEWYGTDQSSYQDFSKHMSQIQTIAPLWATLGEDGTVANRGGDDHQAVVQLAHSNHRSALLLVNNATTGNSAVPIDTLLQDPALRSKAINNLEAYLKKYKLDGINIDFESVSASSKNNLTAFMQELYARLKPEGYIVSIDVFPKENENNDVSVVYDYAKLSQYADKIMLMTYDNHGTWSEAGPIADIGWDERCLKYALQFIPKNKLYLGIAGYGYDWSSKGVESLENSAIMNLSQKFQSDIVWDDASKSPHFSYTGTDGIKHQVWFENAKSIGYKLDLINKYDIAGAALWKLGEEDQDIWPVIQQKFR